MIAGGEKGLELTWWWQSEAWSSEHKFHLRVNFLLFTICLPLTRCGEGVWRYDKQSNGPNDLGVGPCGHQHYVALILHCCTALAGVEEKCVPISWQAFLSLLILAPSLYQKQRPQVWVQYGSVSCECRQRGWWRCSSQAAGWGHSNHGKSTIWLNSAEFILDWYSTVECSYAWALPGRDSSVVVTVAANGRAASGSIQLVVTKSKHPPTAASWGRWLETGL